MKRIVAIIGILALLLAVVVGCASEDALYVQLQDGQIVQVTGAVKFIDQNGDAYGVPNINGKPRVSSMDYGYDIAEGNIAGHTRFWELGYNGDVDDVRETLWPVGGDYVFPAAGQQMEVVSSSADDDSPGGIGALTVEVHYLDSNWEEQSEIITMAGVGVVTTTSTDIYRIQNFHVLTVGSSGYAAGDIDIRNLADTPIYGRIPAGTNYDRQAVWTVPAGMTAFITSWHIGIGNSLGNRYGEFRLEATADMDGTYMAGLFRLFDLISEQDGAQEISYQIPLRLGEKTDIKISATSDSAAANALCGGGWNGWYETN